eukprot:TRINITY_DN3791_c0_g1_i5.p1 TRINITY_DN3791_c0_g1~~TRINITY_DN3791_c0_g1_i5.p1  ORF type:complete len:428 (-),score=55.09 TRINITY_DN3791_c0_g1_i5:211-1494(-)
MLRFLGLSSSKNLSPIFQEAQRYFSEDDLKQMRVNYKKGSIGNDPQPQEVKELLQMHILKSEFLESIFKVIKRIDDSSNFLEKIIISKYFSEVRSEKFLILLAFILTDDQTLRNLDDKCSLSSRQFEKILQLIVCQQLGFEGKWIHTFVNQKQNWSEKDLKSILQDQLHGINAIIVGLFKNFPFRDSHPPAGTAQLPKLVFNAEIKAGSINLISQEWSWLLSGLLPPSQRETWNLLFSSERNGSSFNAFMGRVAEMGPTIIFVREKGQNGNLFGGYAADSWEKKGQFSGSHSTFLFRLKPMFQVFKATGFNQNFQWCGHKFKELPNGFGYGGQIGYYGLFVDGQFEKGMSRSVATFQNESLSSSEEFEVDVVECWQVEIPKEDEWETSNAGRSKSILERQIEDQNLLEMAGKKLYTRDLKEEPLEED